MSRQMQRENVWRKLAWTVLLCVLAGMPVLGTAEKTDNREGNAIKRKSMANLDIEMNDLSYMAREDSMRAKGLSTHVVPVSVETNGAGINWKEVNGDVLIETGIGSSFKRVWNKYKYAILVTIGVVAAIISLVVFYILLLNDNNVSLSKGTNNTIANTTASSITNTTVSGSIEAIANATAIEAITNTTASGSIEAIANATVIDVIANTTSSSIANATASDVIANATASSIANTTIDISPISTASTTLDMLQPSTATDMGTSMSDSVFVVTEGRVEKVEAFQKENSLMPLELFQQSTPSQSLNVKHPL
ncbi:hypothetical protein NECID01_0080 [Nematocida sp. AWRm77]|nr:hypothetical protein NECID01_0080 [Nematocida sp. AWRm77]